LLLYVFRSFFPPKKIESFQLDIFYQNKGIKSKMDFSGNVVLKRTKNIEFINITDIPEDTRVDDIMTYYKQQGSETKTNWLFLLTDGLELYLMNEYGNVMEDVKLQIAFLRNDKGVRKMWKKMKDSDKDGFYKETVLMRS
jgi:hypothetical protein